jgi:hypothetical protein
MGSPVRQELDDEDASAKNLIEEQLCHTQAQDARLTNLRIGPPERARAKFGDNSKTSKPPNSWLKIRQVRSAKLIHSIQS